jgi:hypothetical protein
MQLILFLFEVTVKDNGYVSTKLHQQYKEKEVQYRKEIQHKAIVKEKKNSSLLLWKHPIHIKV